MRIERLPENARARLIHEGHGTFLQPEERKFVTPEAIRGTCVVGTPEEVIAQLRVSEKAGLREAVLKPPAEYQREVLRDVAELVMPAVR